jgi:CRISPR/Cas system-associated endonuclease Cas1
LILDGNGSDLGMEKGCFILKNKQGISRYPLFEQEIGEVILKSGNSISTGALASFGFWDIDVLVMTSRGRRARDAQELKRRLLCSDQNSSVSGVSR